MKNAFCVFFITLIFACGNDSGISDYEQTFRKIIGTEEGIFRGNLLGDDYEKIRNSESGTLLESDSSYLFYEYQLDSSGSYTVEYQFEKNNLSGIRLDAYIRDTEEWKTLFENFRQYYSSKYGVCSREKDSFVWKINSGNIHIVLSDESVDAQEGVLSVEIFYASFPS